MIRNFDRNINDLLKNGFTNIDNFFQKDQINIISNEIQRVFLKDRNNKEVNEHKKNINTSKKIYAKRGCVTTSNHFTGPVLGKSKIIDKFFIKLFDNPEFKSLSEKIVGKNFKIYTLHLRELNNSSKYLGLHQDAYYQASFQIPLNDISKDDSGTCFVSGSHLSKFPLLNQLLSIAEKVSHRFFIFFTKKYQCKVGDFGIFFNKTFHGNTIKKKSKNVSSSILIALNAEGGYNHPPLELPKLNDYKEDFKISIGENLYKRMFSTEDLIEIDNNYFTHLKNIPANPKISKIAPNSSNDNMCTISEIKSNDKKHLLDKVIFDDHHISLNVKLATFYIKSILKVKDFTKKIFY